MNELENDNQVLNGTDENSSNTGDSQNKAGEYTDRERQLFARMKKEQAEKDALAAELAKYKSAPQAQDRPDNVPDIEWRERMELISIHGIKDEETLNFIMKNGGKKALNDDFVKMAIEKRREEAEAKEKVAFNTSPKSSIEKRYTADQLKSMTADEMEAVLNGRKI